MIYGYIRPMNDCSQEVQEKIIYSYSQGRHGNQEFGGMFIDEMVYGRVNIFDRPAGDELADRIKEKDIIVAARLEACFVSMENAADTITELLERNIFFNVAETGYDLTTDGGQIIFDAVVTFSDFSRKKRSRETRDAMAKIKDFGGPVNRNCPIGFKIVRSDGESSFVPDRKERAIAMKIVEWYDTGVKWSEIVRKLSKKKRSNGLKWGQKNVRVAYHAAIDGFPGTGGEKDPFEILEGDRERSRKARLARGINKAKENN